MITEAGAGGERERERERERGVKSLFGKSKSNAHTRKETTRRVCVEREERGSQIAETERFLREKSFLHADHAAKYRKGCETQEL